MPDADLLVPKLPAERFSMADPVRMAIDLGHEIDELWSSRALRCGEGYRRIILVGHSLGGLPMDIAYNTHNQAKEQAPVVRFACPMTSASDSRVRFRD
jgi:hypothetical protein